MEKQRSMKFNRFQMIIMIECIFLFLLLPGCFRREQIVLCLEEKQIEEAGVITEDNVEVLLPKIKMMPGVYQVRIYSDMRNSDQSIYAEVSCDSSTFLALRGNGVNIFPDQDYVDFEVYVVDQLDSAFVRCNINAAGIEALKSVEVVRTNLGCRMLFSILLTVFFVVDVLIWWRKRLLEGKCDVSQLVIVFGLIGIIICAHFPHLERSIHIGSDSFSYILRFEALKESLINGCPLPFRNQGNLFLLFPAFLRMVGFPPGFSYKAFLFFIITAATGVCYFSLYKIAKDKFAALFGTVIYILNPYYIHNIYICGAISECLAMIFMPLVCSGIYLIYTEDANSPTYKKYKWYLVIALSGILQSHLISMELTIFFVILVCVLFWKKTFQKQIFKQLSLTACITLLVSFFINLIQFLLSNGYDAIEPMPGVGLSTGFIMLISVFCSILGVFIYLRWKEKNKKNWKICVLLILALILGGAIYHVNDISLNNESTCFLYTAESIGQVQ